MTKTLSRIKISFLVIFFTHFTYTNGAYSQNYHVYHERINLAEELIFVQNRIQEGLEVYASVFQEFDFVFVFDCLTACQIALLEKDEVHFFAFIEKATANGFMPRHLTHFTFITKQPNYEGIKDSTISLYKKNRPHYLRRLDTNALKWMYKEFAFDQMEKNPLRGETEAKYQIRYKKQIAERMIQMRRLIAEKGFPGDKLIGIDQADIMQELGVDQPDMIEYFHKYKEFYSIGKGQYSIYEQLMASNLHYPIIHHYSYNFSDYTLFPDSFYLDQINKGNLHPNDYAAINDIPYEIFRAKIPNQEFQEKYFGVGTVSDTGKNMLRVSDCEINRYRKKFFISPIENDQAKWQFARKHGMLFRFGGYGGSRT